MKPKLIELLEEIIESADSYYIESNPSVPVILEKIVFNAASMIKILSKDNKKISITEGDTLANIRTTDSYREMPSGPPPSLSKNAEIKSLKLTDKEIVAIEWCVEQWTGIKRAETLRNLLERIKKNER
jgi:hypothetical protein